jgi:flavorubredoxin
LSQKNIDVKIFNLADADLSDIVREVVDAGVIVLGAPTFVNGLHPDMIYFANLAKIIKPPTKNMAILESHGWGGGAVSAMKTILEPLTPNLLGIVDVVARPTAEDLKRVEALGEEIVKEMSKS